MNLHPSLSQELDSLESAEDFMEYFEIQNDQNVVHTNRLHILQRFHDYIERNSNNMPDSADDQRSWLKNWLSKAYEDFVNSNALKEKVFRVFRDTPGADGGTSTFVPVEEMFK